MSELKQKAVVWKKPLIIQCEQLGWTCRDLRRDSRRQIVDLIMQLRWDEVTFEVPRSRVPLFFKTGQLDLIFTLPKLVFHQWAMRNKSHEFSPLKPLLLLNPSTSEPHVSLFLFDLQVASIEEEPDDGGSCTRSTDTSSRPSDSTGWAIFKHP